VGNFPKLEEQMTTYTGANTEKSPDRMDALVWALTDLMLGTVVAEHVDPYTVQEFDWMA
jgi:phage terminase large subunit-like protein